jgi:hypothetical protein
MMTTAITIAVRSRPNNRRQGTFGGSHQLTQEVARFSLVDA